MLGKLRNFSNHVSGKLSNVVDGASGRCINIGCGTDVRPFWVNCDLIPLEPSVQKFNIKSTSDLGWLREQSSDIIECNHVIGYLNLAQTVNFFCAAHDALKAGVKFIVEFPCARKVAALLSEVKLGPNYESEYRGYSGALRIRHPGCV